MGSHGGGACTYHGRGWHLCELLSCKRVLNSSGTWKPAKRMVGKQAKQIHGFVNSNALRPSRWVVWFTEAMCKRAAKSVSVVEHGYLLAKAW
jgi:hypothetical protein